MIAALRTLLVTLVLLTSPTHAATALQPGDLQAYVERDRSEAQYAGEVLPIFDAMVAKARSGPTGFRQLDDVPLQALAADTEAINFYFLGSRPAAHADVFAELERRRIVSDLQVSGYHRTLVAARHWDEAKALARRFPKVELETLPAHFDPGEDSPGLKAWDFDPASQTLRRRALGIEKSLALVIVSHPRCGFSRAAIQALQSDPALAEALPHPRYFVAPTFGGLGLESVGAWNAVHSESRHVLVDRPLDWTFVKRWNTPQFFFLVDGKVVEQVEGWPDDGQKQVLMEAARRARARTRGADLPIADGR